MKCWLNDPKIHQYCCSCEFHLIDYEHCDHNRELRDKTGKCICNIQKGWICCNPEIYEGKGASSGWPEHSIGCELYKKKGRGVDAVWIYESPDNGKTVFRRPFGDYDAPREKVVTQSYDKNRESILR